MLRDHCIFCRRKKKIWFNIICLNLYQFERITRWCLFVLKSIMEYVMEHALKIVLLKNTKKIMVSRNLRQAHPLEVGLT